MEEYTIALLIMEEYGFYVRYRAHGGFAGG